MAAETVWEQIKTEFITKDVKPRELARKYRVSKNTIYQRAKDEDWEGQKGHFREETGTKIREAIQQQQVDDAVQILNVADKILERCADILEQGHIKHMSPAGMKNLSETLINIKTLKNIRSAEDIEEQRARIDKLRREADKEDRSTTVTVTLEGEMDSYGS